MARIIVTSEPADGNDRWTAMEERVLPGQLESEHFSARLVERLSWAVTDAAAVERDARAPTAANGSAPTSPG